MFQPLGVILTVMNWRKLQWLIFNIGLLVWQLIFFTWTERFSKYDRHALRFVILAAGLFYLHAHYGWWSDIPTWHAFVYLGASTLWSFIYPRGNSDNFMTIKSLWRTAQVCHVRLCVSIDDTGEIGQFLSYSFPRLKYEYFNYSRLDTKRFIYMEPNLGQSFSPHVLAVLTRIVDSKLSNKHARGYDWAQLFSFVINLPFWIIFPWTFGKEVIGIVDLGSLREVCSSGIAIILDKWQIMTYNDLQGVVAKFFAKFISKSMVPPGEYILDKHWKEDVREA